MLKPCDACGAYDISVTEEPALAGFDEGRDYDGKYHPTVLVKTVRLCRHCAQRAKTTVIGSPDLDAIQGFLVFAFIQRWCRANGIDLWRSPFKPSRPAEDNHA